MLTSFRILFTLLSLALFAGCAGRSTASDPGPLVEVCPLNTSDPDPTKWHAACALKEADPDTKLMSKVRSPKELNGYVCEPAHDLQSIILWAHSR